MLSAYRSFQLLQNISSIDSFLFRSSRFSIFDFLMLPTRASDDCSFSFSISQSSTSLQSQLFQLFQHFSHCGSNNQLRLPSYASLSFLYGTTVFPIMDAHQQWWQQYYGATTPTAGYGPLTNAVRHHYQHPYHQHHQHHANIPADPPTASPAPPATFPPEPLPPPAASHHPTPPQLGVVPPNIPNLPDTWTPQRHTFGYKYRTWSHIISDDPADTMVQEIQPRRTTSPRHFSMAAQPFWPTGPQPPHPIPRTLHRHSHHQIHRGSCIHFTIAAGVAGPQPGHRQHR